MSQLDTKSLKSAEEITSPGQIIEHVLRADELWRRANPRAAETGFSNTEIKLDADVMVVSKRASGLDLSSAITQTAEELQELAERRGFEWEDGAESRVIPYWASDSRRDRHEDVVLQNWKLDDFWNNPVMLYGHRWEEPPIGGVIDASVTPRSEGSYDGDALRVLSMFASKEAYPFADTVYRLAKAKIMRAGSVGFFPGRVLNVKDKKERQQLGLGESGLVFDDNNLVEWTLCSVPANPGATQQYAMAKSMGLLLPTDVQAIRSMAKAETRAERWSEKDARLRAMWKLLYPEAKIPDSVEEEVSTKTVVAVPEQKGFTEIIQQLLGDMQNLMQETHQMVSDMRDAMELADPSGDDEDDSSGDDNQPDDVENDDEDEDEEQRDKDVSDQEDEESDQVKAEDDERDHGQGAGDIPGSPTDRRQNPDDQGGGSQDQSGGDQPAGSPRNKPKKPKPKAAAAIEDGLDPLAVASAVLRGYEE